MKVNSRGAAFMVASMALFSLEDAVIKSMSGALPAGQILALLGGIGACVFAIVLRVNGKALFPAESWQTPVVLRNLAEASGSLCFVIALTKVDLALASAILQAAPLLVTFGAVIFLAERVGWRRWAAMAVGFLGVLIILRPGFSGFEPAALWAVAGMFGLAMRDVATRRVPAQMHSLQLAFQAFLLLLPTGLIASYWMGIAPVTPSLWLRVFATVAVGLVAYWLLVQATRIGDVSFVTPFRYSRMLFALTMGFLVFGETSDIWTWLGIALIVGSGMFTFFRERKQYSAL